MPVFQMSGFAMETTTAVITVTSLSHVLQQIELVAEIFSNVEMGAASQVPGSVTETKTARTKKMNQIHAYPLQRLPVSRPTFVVNLANVFLAGGDVITMMIALMGQMRKNVRKVNSEFAPKRKEHVIVESAFILVRGAMGSQIARIRQMRCSVILTVQRKNSDANFHLIAFLRIGNVTGKGTAVMGVTRKIVL